MGQPQGRAGDPALTLQSGCRPLALRWLCRVLPLALPVPPPLFPWCSRRTGGLRSRRIFHPPEGSADVVFPRTPGAQPGPLSRGQPTDQRDLWRHDKIEFLCECSDTACVETVELRLTDYEEFRANPIRFVIKPRHEIDAIERVVAEDGGYAVVEKHKAEADLIDMDPRSGTGS